MTPHEPDTQQPARVVWLLKDGPHTTEPVPHTEPAQPARRTPHAGELDPHDDDPEILEGTILDDEDDETDELPALLAVIDDLMHSPTTEIAIRQAGHLVVGTVVVARRIRDSRTPAPLERLLRSAEAAGDREAALELVERIAEFRRDRHARRMDLIEMPARVLAVLPKAAIATVGGLTTVGVLLAVATHDPTQVTAPFLLVADTVGLIVLIVSVTWLPAALAAPFLGLLTLWLIGRHNTDTTDIGWVNAVQPAETQAEVIVTADSIVRALQHLRVPELKKAFKDGWIPAFHQPPVRDGRGYWAVVELPLGVTPEMVADLRPILARNLSRAEVETWPSDANRVETGPAGYLDLWVADSGALSKAAPEYPLIHEGTADVFKGVPAGVSPRGDVITIPITGNNFVAGGMMGQGKSNACRVVMLGAALDPLAELRVFVFAGNGDFDAYEPRLSRYERGATDEVTQAGLESLYDLYEEVGRREQRLAELGAKKVTRKLAQEHPDLRPILSLYSECHELFGHAEYGAAAADIAVQTIRRARKTALWLGFDTQSSRKDAIPPKIVELVSVNACFAVKSWRSNDGFLGDGSFAAGIRATELRPTTDRGTSLITGVSDAPFELLKWHFIEVNDDTGWDAATDVIARAVAGAAPGTPLDSPPRLREIENRDLLEDLDKVLGHDRIRLKHAIGQLCGLAPRYRPYQSLTVDALRKQLGDEGVDTVKTGNVVYLDPEQVRQEIARRSTADLDDWS